MTGAWAKSNKKDQTERATGLTRPAEEQERGEIEKWDQTESPEIPDRVGETSEIPGLPSRVKGDNNNNNNNNNEL